jgi:hypothetical protein
MRRRWTRREGPAAFLPGLPIEAQAHLKASYLEMILHQRWTGRSNRPVGHGLPSVLDALSR